MLFSFGVFKSEKGVFRGSATSARFRRFLPGGISIKMWLPLLVFVFALHIPGTLGAKDDLPEITNVAEINEKLQVIYENATINQVIVTVRATEKDNAVITYSINDKTFFQIDEDTGDISLKTTWDYETSQKALSLDITATDSEGDAATINQIILLQNVNDRQPDFQNTQQSEVLPENAALGREVMVVSVRDVDEGENKILNVTCVNRYYNPNDDTCDIFMLVPRGRSNKHWLGVIKLNALLDYEKTNSYAIRLNASDGVNIRTQEFQIEVTDINDSPPYFVRAESKLIPEGYPVGTYIDYVLARDSDKTGARPIRYELIGDMEALEYFSLSKVEGNITNKLVLDYEDPRLVAGKFTLQVKAMELLSQNPEVLGNDSRTTAVTSLTITLKDENDNCPLFGKDLYPVQLLEDVPDGSRVVDLELKDADYLDNNRRFEVSLRDPTQTFQLEYIGDQTPASILLTVKDSSRIDYESARKEYNVVVIARDKGRTDCSASALVRIALQDINDETPKFEKTLYRATVVENAGASTSIIKLKATDGDSGLFGTDGLRYSFIGNTENLFSIDSFSGLVTVAYCASPGTRPCIDYEWEKSHTMSVRVVDNRGNSPSNVEIAELVIDVINVNDNLPQFIGNYTRYIREGKRETETDLTVKAFDGDDDRITYALVQGQRDGSFWNVNPVTGKITARAPIYRSNTTSASGLFAFDVTASDGSNSAVAGIRIIVIDVNLHDPKFANTEAEVTIREDFPGNTFVKEVTVTDADSPTSINGQVVISIESGSKGKFKVSDVRRDGNYFLANVSTEAKAKFDYDIDRQFILILKARDKGTPARTGTSTLTVNIQDINNKNPYFEPPTMSESVSEKVFPGTSVITVTAKDNDELTNLKIEFGEPIIARDQTGTLVTDPALYKDLFTITEDGLVRTNAKLNRDIVSTLDFPLVVKDTAANPVQTGTGSLYIRILEYNDQAPQFELPLYVFYVKEERARGTFVNSLLAIDEDDEIASYKLTDNPDNLFDIAKTTGVLTVNGRLDYEARHNVTLTAMASDTGEPQESNTTRVLIHIININDNAPVFSEAIYKIDLLEHSMRTDALTSVFATDKDEGDFGVVRYFANDTYFTVDGITGEVFLKPGANLDREEFTTHTFEVTAYDSPLNASVRLFTTSQVYVELADINDNCPMFNDGNSFSGSIIETADVGDQVLEMFASDADDGNNRTIVFEIDGSTMQPPEGRNLFSILSIQSLTANIESGRIEVNSSLRGKADTYTFTVVASDQKGKNITGDMCSTRVNVTVRVQAAVNDPPVWILPPSRNFSIDVLESQYLGMLVYDCKARDINPGKEGIVDYFFNVNQVLRSTTPEFRINRVTGVISARIVYDREQVASYVLPVVAKDQGNPSSSSETVLIIRVLDVNDNDPEFPMKNGETIPINFTVTEGVTPERDGELGLIGVVSATDIDSDHRNNKVYYKIMAGNDDGLFEMGRDSGKLKLSPLGMQKGIDREAQSVYKMDVLAYNDVHDDSVIRYRRKRSTNPSIVTVIVTVNDTNDTPPKFSKTDYYGCVPRNAPFGQSVLKVEAVDQDVNRAQFMNYTKIQESSDGFFMIDSVLGDIRNAKLLYEIDSDINTVVIQVDDNGYKGNTATTTATIFVTDADNEVKVVVAQPSADVRYYKEQLIKAMINTSSPTPISHVCIREIRDHVGDDGTYSYTSTDVFLSGVYNDGGQNKLYSGDRLQSILLGQLSSYQTLHVKTVERDSEEDEVSLTEDPVLAIFIIALLLILLAIILFCLAICLIWNSKKKKIKKLKAVEHRPVEVVHHQPAPEVGPNVNPVYDNHGFDDGNEYAVVQKRRPAPENVGPPIVPIMVPADPSPDFPGEEPEPEPYIVTEPVMSEEQPEMQPPPEDFFVPEVEAVPEPEPVIETVIETEVVPDDDDYYYPEPPQMTSPEDEIDVEFRDIQDSPSPRRSPSPPSPTADEEYRIETNFM